MKTYLIAIAVTGLGLWASSQAEAKDFCGQRSATMLGVKQWEASLANGTMTYRVTLRSTQEKAIKQAGGTIEVLGKGLQRVASAPIVFPTTVAAMGEAVVEFTAPATEANKRLLDRAKNEVHVLACVDSVEFADGSGMIIN
jgi:hypothetical protein